MLSFTHSPNEIAAERQRREMRTMCEDILELKSITKIFPGVKALNGVDFSLRRGEVHALMGENGAGKSTFIKVITGVHQADEGEMLLNGQKVVFKSPRDAQKHRIAAIYQHGTAYPHLTVTENIFMGHEAVSAFGTLQWRKMHREAEKLLNDLGSTIDPKSVMGNLTVAEQQIVEIAKAISTNADILIMDEPTAALSGRECEELYHITDKLKSGGVSIIFISHRFEDMYRLADRVTVFRDAAYIGTWEVSGISHDKLIAAMVGREINQIYPKTAAKPGAEVLRAEKLCRTGYFHNVSFSVKQGEILGLTGLVGAGRTEVCQSIFGIEPLTSGTLYFAGEKVKIRRPSDAMALGIGYLPEDRQKQGLILDWEIYKNETLSTLEKFTKRGVLIPKEERSRAKTLSEKLAVKAVSVFDKAASLSGGNQQKIIVAKLLNSDLKLLILDEPTKGVDVGAKAQIYKIISDLAKGGYGILLISSEMPEVLGMADRIAVMHQGVLTAVFDRDGATQEKILEAAMGLNPEFCAGKEGQNQ